MAAIETGVPLLVEARELIARFQSMIRKRATAEPGTWLAQARSSLAASFAMGIMKDPAAVTAAFNLPWSNGQTEGQITKLKLVKRQMYGRGKIDMLQARMICITYPTSPKMRQSPYSTPIRDPVPGPIDTPRIMDRSQHPAGAQQIPWHTPPNDRRCPAARLRFFDRRPSDLPSHAGGAGPPDPRRGSSLDVGGRAHGRPFPELSEIRPRPVHGFPVGVGA